MDLIESGVRNPINHWYYAHKFWFIANSRFFKSEGDKYLVDIGAGSALFSKELLKRNLITKSVAVDTGYVEEYDDLSIGISFRKTTPYSGYTHFLLTDVIEHIEDDGSFLGEIVSAADNGSCFVITVPALMSLWSGHDVYLKHFRRYTKSSLVNLAMEAGLTVKSVRYTYSTLFPIAFLQRKIFGTKSNQSQMRDNGVFVRVVLKALLIPDRWITSFPFGVSIFLEATKHD